MPKTLNIAVIGAGTMAQAVHLPVLRRRWDRFTIAALVDHSPRRRREASEVWGVAEEKRYETVTDLLAAVRARTLELDAAVLSTDGLHAEDLLALMRRGIRVLVEPPLGFSAAEVQNILDFERMTGRRMLMTAYPQQYDDSVTRMSEHIGVKDLRMVDHEVLMPASQPLFGAAHVTTSSYDLPTEVRSKRRKDLQAAVEAGSGDAATQRDRDLYVKGLLTGMAHQLAVTEAAYGPVTTLRMVRHWPKGVIPGSLELLGELEGGAQVRLVWHYLPFAPEYSESVQVLSARRRMRLDLPAPSHGDQRSSLSVREKKSGVVQETATTAPKGSAELMWEAFHAFVEKGTEPLSGTAEALAQVELLREVLASIVEADGRRLDKTEEERAADAAEAAAKEAEKAEKEAAKEAEKAERAAAAAASDAERSADSDAASAADPSADTASAEPLPTVSIDRPAVETLADAPAADPAEAPADGGEGAPVVDAWSASAQEPASADADPSAAQGDPAAAPADPTGAPADPSAEGSETPRD